MQATSRVRQRLAWCGYALAVLGAFLAGHPETLFFAWGLVLVYVPLRLLVSRELGGGRERLAKAGQFVVATGLAVGLAAVQLLPFVEYLHRSTAYADGSVRAQAHYSLAYSGLHAFPNLFGAPSRELLPAVAAGRRPAAARTAPGWASNYIEANGAYVGLLVLLLAAVGAVSLIRRRVFVGVFMAVAAAIWVVYVHDRGRDRPHRRQPAAGGAEHHQPQPSDLGLRRLLPGRLRRRRPAAGRRGPLAVGGGRGRGRGRHARPGRGGPPGPAHAQGGREPRRARGRADRPGLGRRPPALHRLLVPRRAGDAGGAGGDGRARSVAAGGGRAGGGGGGLRPGRLAAPRPQPHRRRRPGVRRLAGPHRGGDRGGAVGGDGVAGRAAVGRRQPLVPPPVPRLLRRDGRPPLRTAAEGPGPAPVPAAGGAGPWRCWGFATSPPSRAFSPPRCRPPACRRSRRSPPP